MEVLVHGMARGFGAWIGRLVDEHGVHGHNVWTDETLDIVQHLTQ